MFWQWLENFFHHWQGEWSAEKIVIAALAAAMAAVAIKLLILLSRWAWRQIQELLGARRRLRYALWAVSEKSPGVWLSKLPSKRDYPADYAARIATSKPILTVANLKGGVGKTTIAANLAAHYAYQGDRILFIDLDFQGSSSAMMLPGDHAPDTAARLVDGGGKDILLREADPLRLDWAPNGLQPDARGIPADYSLARADNRVMVKFLLREYDTDPRYLLAEALLHPMVQARYDRVIIDAPPRMVSGQVQALCASTHVLIPTNLDRLAAEGALRFVNQLDQERKLWPALQIAGVTAVKCNGNLGTIAEKDTIGFLIDGLEKTKDKPPLFWQNAFIKQNALLAQAAGQYSVYGAASSDAQHTNLRNMFKELAGAIETGARTYETWKAWLIDPNRNTATRSSGSNGFGESAQPPLLPIQ
jgi:chromosome partitioning protein